MYSIACGCLPGSGFGRPTMANDVSAVGPSGMPFEKAPPRCRAVRDPSIQVIKEVEDFPALILLRVKRELHRKQVLRLEAGVGIEDAYETLDQQAPRRLRAPARAQLR